ncbi:MAG: hypothetical protein IT261_10635 [Saprospiraceae bacterium]|nr:hypothetical protein [Saprospiraceae bacterium]
MKKTIFFSTALLLGTAMVAQESQPVVILQTTGKVSLVSQGKKKGNPVAAGAVANPPSSLMLSKDASALVYCGGQYKTIKDTEKAELNSVCGNAPAAKKLNIDYDLGDKIMAAVDMVVVANAKGDGWARGVAKGKRNGDGWSSGVGEKSKSGDGWGAGIGDKSKSGDGWGAGIGDKSKSGDGWGTGVGDKSKTGDGWGGKGYSIHAIMPFGNVADEEIEFQWSKPSGNSGFQVVIKDETGKVVYQITSLDSFRRIDLKVLNLEKGKGYRWQVWTTDSRKLTSEELLFVVQKKEERQAVVDQAIKSSSLNLKDLPEVKSLAEAVALEKEEWFYDAAKRYASTQQKGSGTLVPMMHAAFWKRYGFSSLSEKAIRNQ